MPQLSGPCEPSPKTQCWTNRIETTLYETAHHLQAGRCTQWAAFKILPFLFFIATAIFTFCLYSREPDHTTAKFPEIYNSSIFLVWHLIPCFWAKLRSVPEDKSNFTMTKKFIQYNLLWINPAALHFFCQLFLQIFSKLFQSYGVHFIFIGSRNILWLFIQFLHRSGSKNWFKNKLYLAKRRK